MCLMAIFRKIIVPRSICICILIYFSKIRYIVTDIPGLFMKLAEYSRLIVFTLFGTATRKLLKYSLRAWSKLLGNYYLIVLG
ncbi:hypothetical protein D3C85_1429380 [compost metagenome]